MDNLVSLPLTHVYYDPSRQYGLISAFLALVPIALLVAYPVSIYERREIRTCHAFSGQLACEALNFALKRMFKQARPEHVIGLGKGYGMPSSHSQFMGYFAAYVVLTLYGRKRTLTRSMQMAGAVMLSAAVCASRVYLAYHTTNQVYVGATIGVVFGIVWYVLLDALYSHGLIDTLLDLRISQNLYLKDSSTASVLEGEWKEWRKIHGKRRKEA